MKTKTFAKGIARLVLIWDHKHMNVIRHRSQLRDFLSRAEGPRVLVPTMGALHDGHLALLAKAREVAGNQGTVVVSIFVNPIQFDSKTDLAAYPRNEDADLAACNEADVDVVFIPVEGEMYEDDCSVTVNEERLSAGLCGSTRPGHFAGVCTVVLKLFLLSNCDVAVFGEKDMQQLAIIRRMIRDLDISVKIVTHPTLREADGLAMSSRNARLNDQYRADAPRIYRALSEAAKKSSLEEILAHAQIEIEASGLARIDYLQVVDARNLEPLNSLDAAAILAVAVFYGDVRLIDHVLIPSC